MSLSGGVEISHGKSRDVKSSVEDFHQRTFSMENVGPGNLHGDCPCAVTPKAGGKCECAVAFVHLQGQTSLQVSKARQPVMFLAFNPSTTSSETKR